MEETGILENPALLSLVLPDFEPARIYGTFQAVLTLLNTWCTVRDRIIAIELNPPADMRTMINLASSASRPLESRQSGCQARDRIDGRSKRTIDRVDRIRCLSPNN